MLIARTPLWEDRCFTQTRGVQVVEIKNSRSIGFPKGREYDHVLPPFLQTVHTVCLMKYHFYAVTILRHDNECKSVAAY